MDDPTRIADLGVVVEELTASRNSVIVLRDDLTIAFTNQGWDHFAGLVSADRPIVESYAPSIRRFFRRLFARVTATKEPAFHEYECPSPSLQRRFRLRVSPLERGLLLIHHLIAEGATSHTPCPRLAARYVTPEGMLVQCCHCRMTRRGADTSTWDWVPDWVARQPDNLSHGLCPSCFAHYYPTLVARRAQHLATSALGSDEGLPQPA